MERLAYTIVIATFERPAELARMLASVAEQTRQPASIKPRKFLTSASETELALQYYLPSSSGYLQGSQIKYSGGPALETALGKDREQLISSTRRQ